MEATKLRKWILQTFTLNGYNVRADAASYLASQFLPINSRDRQKWMDKITDHLQKLNLKTIIVDKEHIELCLEECTKKQPSTETIFNVINVFDAPCFAYNPDRKKFMKDDSFVTKGLFPPASVKSFIYKRRYITLLERMKRHDFFRKQELSSKGPQFQLRNVEWFLCCTDKISNAVILGLLVQKNESTYHIEDLTGSLQLDLLQTKFSSGLFPEHSFVFAEGIYDDKIFYVTHLGYPPPETSKISRSYFGNVNTFGGPSEICLSQSANLLKIQNENAGAMIVFLSDIWLDKIQVLDKLAVLFSGFADQPPFAFVLMGNFLSSHMGSSHAENLKLGFKNLGDVLLNTPSICENSYFVVIPGPTDPGSPLIFPRAPIPDSITEDFRSKVPKAIMGTNPCRIQYCAREIVCIREDLITKMCRNTIHFPETEEIFVHFAKTIISQGTLIPMSLNVCPVYWNYSHGLDIYPLPDLIVTGDQFNAFTTKLADCTVMNPGTFMKSGFSFRVYIPCTNEIEESVIPDD